MMDDFSRPVPAARAPAFCTKNTSSLGGYLAVLVIIFAQIVEGRLDVPYNRFVKDWVRVRGRDQSQRRVWPNDIVKLVVVDVERLGSEGLLSGAGPKKHLLGVSKVQT